MALLLTSGIVTTALLGQDSAKASSQKSATGAPPLLGSVGSVIENNTAPPAAVSTVSNNATVGGTGPEGATPEPFRVDGKGDDVTPVFQTEQGLLRVSILYLGDGYFRASFVNMDDETASIRALSAPSEGDYEGSRYIGLAPGNYTIDIRSGDASGVWSITVSQPRDADASPVPAKSAGEGDVADLSFLAQEGGITFQTSHSAELGEFVIRLYDAQGNLVRRGGSEAIVSDYGDHSGTVTINLPANGVYFVDVQAAGSWSVRASQS